MNIEELSSADEEGGRRVLDTFLETVRSKLWELSETVTREYFTHAVSRTSGGSVSREIEP